MLNVVVSDLPGHARIENNFMALPAGAFETDYICVSGYFGKAGPYVYAAAEDMYAALKDAAFALESVVMLTGNDAVVPYVEAAKVALAKAEGGE